jgi:hypothetical protein
MSIDSTKVAPNGRIAMVYRAASEEPAPSPMAAGSGLESGQQPSAGPAGQVSNPGRLTRIAVMHRYLLDEARGAALDGAGLARLAEIHQRAVDEVIGTVSEPLRTELRTLRPSDGESAPTTDELRVAQAQLLGWLAGLFRGIQTAELIEDGTARARLLRSYATQAQTPESTAEQQPPTPARPPGNYL